MIRQLVVSYVLLVAIAIGAFTIPVAWVLTEQLRQDAVSAASREADTAVLLVAAGDTPSRQALERLTDAYQRQTPGRLNAVFGALTVSGRPDTALGRALAGERVVSWGYQPTLDADGLIVAVPARAGDGTVVGAVAVVYPSEPLRERQWQIWGFRAALAVGVLIAAALLGFLLAKRLTSPLRALTSMAGRLRDGDLTVQVEESGPVEIRTLARTLNTATATIDSLVRSQRTFIANASHQLRTPLTALRLSLDNISDAASDPALRDDVDQASAEVVRMSRLVNGLLALARAEGDVSAPERIRTSEVVGERFDAWRAAAEEKQVRLRQLGPRPGPAALITRGHLEQILDNLLANALEASEPDTEITVETRTVGDYVTISVSDQGPGIAPALREQAFERFWRGGSRPGGSGLGLAIVKQLVEDDEGEVRLAGDPGDGLTVVLTFKPA